MVRDSGLGWCQDGDGGEGGETLTPFAEGLEMGRCSGGLCRIQGWLWVTPGAASIVPRSLQLLPFPMAPHGHSSAFAVPPMPWLFRVFAILPVPMSVQRERPRG